MSKLKREQGSDSESEEVSEFIENAEDVDSDGSNMRPEYYE